MAGTRHAVPQVTAMRLQLVAVGQQVPSQATVQNLNKPLLVPLIQASCTLYLSQYYAYHEYMWLFVELKNVSNSQVDISRKLRKFIHNTAAGHESFGISRALGSTNSSNLQSQLLTLLHFSISKTKVMYFLFKTQVKMTASYAKKVSSNSIQFREPSGGRLQN